MNQDTRLDLAEVRELIDSVDRELIMLLKQRSRLVDLVIENKKVSSKTAHQPERFAQMVANLQAIAKAEDLDPQLVTEVWNSIHESSQRQQNKQLR